MTNQAPFHLTDRAKRVLGRARDEQARLGHRQLTAEHILYGLLADLHSVAVWVLRELKVDVKGLTERTRSELERGASTPVVDQTMVVRAAERWAAELKQVSVGTEHLLLGLVTSGSAAATWLAEAGVRESEAKSATERVLPVAQRRSGPSAMP